MSNAAKKKLSPEQREELLRALKTRFEKNMNRHEGLQWVQVQSKLDASSEKLWAVNEMERTGGEPDVVDFDKKTGRYIFMIVQRKVRKAAGASATTARHLSRAKKTGRQGAPGIWRRPWASSF